MTLKWYSFYCELRIVYNRNRTVLQFSHPPINLPPPRPSQPPPPPNSPVPLKKREKKKIDLLPSRFQCNSSSNDDNGIESGWNNYLLNGDCIGRRGYGPYPDDRLGDAGKTTKIIVMETKNE